METFGERVRRLRKERGLTVTALAQRIQISEGGIRQIESGQTKQAAFDTGLKLAAVLAVSPAELAWGQSGSTNLPLASQDSDRLRVLEDQLREVQTLLANLNERVIPLFERASAEEQLRNGKHGRLA